MDTSENTLTTKIGETKNLQEGKIIIQEITNQEMKIKTGGQTGKKEMWRLK
ncbi:uncharacterized protein G2W53_018552 [Senna tora]|uniref:Uncharacterized protein n=1 Tax=Senna tora TaxID=362788 RepID=A0A834WNG1_9FABA|nr:uncharacterized protein G2W53_018552 [Senna tora]